MYGVRGKSLEPGDLKMCSVLGLDVQYTYNVYSASVSSIVLWECTESHALKDGALIESYE